MPPKPAAKPGPAAAKPAPAKPAPAKPAPTAAKKPVAQKPAAAPAKTAAKTAPPAKAANQQTKGPAPKERKEHAGVFIKGIPATDRLEDIKKVFKVVGNITAARRRGGKYCLLWFDTPSAVRKAIDTFHNKTIHSHKITVQQAKAAPPLADSEVCKTIFIGGIPIEKLDRNLIKKRAEIRKALSSCGDIMKVRVYRSGCAFVYFKDVKSANKARADFNGMKLFGTKVNVALSHRTKERDALRYRRGANRTKIYKALRELRGRKIAH